MSTRADIMAAIKTCLESITTDNGFALSVVEVRRGLSLPEEFAQRPALAFFSINRPRKDQTNEQSEALLEFVIQGFADAPNGNFTTFDALMAAVEKALMTAAYNPYREDTKIDNTASYEGGSSDPVGIFDMHGRIFYEYQMASP